MFGTRAMRWSSAKAGTVPIRGSGARGSFRSDRPCSSFFAVMRSDDKRNNAFAVFAKSTVVCGVLQQTSSRFLEKGWVLSGCAALPLKKHRGLPWFRGPVKRLS
jgi:hypothetical protein